MSNYTSIHMETPYLLNPLTNQALFLNKRLFKPIYRTVAVNQTFD